MPLARCNTIQEIEPRSRSRDTAASLIPEPKNKDDEPVILPSILIVMNVIQGIIGISCFGLLIFLRYDKSIIRPEIQKVIRSSEEELEPFLLASGLTVDTVVESFDLQDAIGKFSLVLIPVGFAILFPVLWGMAASIAKRKLLLALYMTMLMLTFLGELSFVIILTEFRYLLDDTMKSHLLESLEHTYKGDQATDNISLLWNAVMLKFSCCGVNGGRDFTMSDFHRDVTFKILGKSYTINNLETPLVCCKHSLRTTTSRPGECAMEPLSEMYSHVNTGCFNEVMDALIGNYSIYGTAFITALFLWQIISFAITLILLRQIKQMTQKDR